MPYRACDVPSERSEFKHPDVAILLTHLAYYESGLPMEDMLNALRALMPSHDSSPSFQQAIYRCATCTAWFHHHRGCNGRVRLSICWFSSIKMCPVVPHKCRAVLQESGGGVHARKRRQ